MMFDLNEFFRSHHEVRLSKISSGDSERDSIASIFLAYFTGDSKEAEKLCDTIQTYLISTQENLIVKRIGPRELRITPFYNIRHHSDKTISF